MVKCSWLTSERTRADVVECGAASVSLLCLLHCLALPLLLLAVPGVIELFVRSEALHVAAVAFVIPAAAAAFWLGYRQHGATWPAVLGVAGAAFLIAAVSSASAPVEAYVMATGSSALLLAHVFNWQLRRHGR